MRKFITSDDIRKILKNTKSNERPIIYINKNDVITAEAKDLAKTLGVIISYEEIKRKPFICANFKMNGNLGFIEKYIVELKSTLAQIYPNAYSEIDIVIAPQAPLIPITYSLIKSKEKIYICAQNCSIKESGALTGEISPKLLNECGAEYVIIGHSERRQNFNETDSMIAQKLKSAIDFNLTPILCIGETYSERQNKKTNDVILKMLSVIYTIPIEYAKKIIIAYEPVWAIGTNNNATNEEISEVCNLIRKDIFEKLGVDFSNNIRILYGGSVNAINALEISQIKGIDGVLVGLSSLNAIEFAKIISTFKPK